MLQPAYNALIYGSSILIQKDQKLSNAITKRVTDPNADIQNPTVFNNLCINNAKRLNYAISVRKH